ncbi:MAG TPA: HAD family phosphatase [Candidatus Saccharimonadales bacterium]|nr:HAD family phosphatase [Candidatus Saccharimonadales bacterium]
MEALELTNIKGILFDMDGTMVDNTAYHKKAWEEFYKVHHMQFPDKDFRMKFSGKNNKQIFQMIFGENISDEDINKFADEKELMYRKLYASNIKPIKGLFEFIEKLKKKDIKIAVATTAIKENRDFILKELGLNNAFDAIIGYEDIIKGKPNPEIFLKAAAALHIKPESCIVFEDAPSGIEAAKRAGMKTVGVVTSHTNKELLADRKIENFVGL